MNVAEFLNILMETKVEVLGIPCINDTLQAHLFSILNWAMEGKPEEGRQLWFCAENAKELYKSFPPYLRGRILAIQTEKCEAIFRRGPFESLLLPKHGFSYSNPNLLLSEFWKKRGHYVLYEKYSHEILQFWIWKSFHKPLHFFGMDHHPAVLWDVKQILKPLGMALDFFWLSDGRSPVNEAIPTQLPGFANSLDIYKPSPEQPLNADFEAWMKEKKYDGIITSHSLITAFRLRSCGLPQIHVNSTRFGNEWIQNPEQHQILVKALEGLIQQNKLRILHNNYGDAMYFHQFFSPLEPHQEIVVPSLCESLFRLRIKAPKPHKILIWDTRQTLLQKNGSPFMKELYEKMKKLLGDAVDSQAILLAKDQDYLPEGYLDDYVAIVHIPYNISTMSIREQTRANIPVWIPSPSLLQSLWCDPKEPNELSWTVFKEGTEEKASPLDHARNAKAVEKWVKTADFYDKERMSCVCTFDSIDNLLTKICSTDYQEIMDQSEAFQQQKREEIFFAYEQLICKS